MREGMSDTTHNEEVIRREVIPRLERIESALTELRRERTIKDWYSTAEVAGILGRADYTVREWCRQGRVRARKKPCGRGKGGEWLVSHDELTRLKSEGLLAPEGAPRAS
jgi:hypothetical protein